jgi:hypothetical protein
MVSGDRTESRRAGGSTLNPLSGGIGAGVIVDRLDNLSKEYASSSTIGFDESNAAYMSGDTSRADRATSTHAYIIWKHTGMISFQAIAYF